MKYSVITISRQYGSGGQEIEHTTKIKEYQNSDMQTA